jgi:integrase
VCHWCAAPLWRCSLWHEKSVIRLYDLRHTATISLEAGSPQKVISEQLGHASVAFTLDVYSHVLPHMQDAAAEKVQALLINTAVA